MAYDVTERLRSNCFDIRNLFSRKAREHDGSSSLWTSKLFMFCNWTLPFMGNRWCTRYTVVSKFRRKENCAHRRTLVALCRRLNLYVLVSSCMCLVARGAYINILLALSSRCVAFSRSLCNGLRTWVIGAMPIVRLFENFARV